MNLRPKAVEVFSFDIGEKGKFGAWWSSVVDVKFEIRCSRNIYQGL